MLEVILKEVLTLSVAGGVVALAILIIRALFWRKIPARLQYAVWTLLIIRLVLPVVPSSPISVFSLNLPSAETTATVRQSAEPAADGSGSGSIATHSGTKIQTAAQANAVTGNVHWQSDAADPAQSAVPPSSFGLNLETAAFVWLLGMAALLLYYFIVNLAVRMHLSRLASCRDCTVMAALDDCRTRLGLRKPVNVVCNNCNSRNSCAKSPAVFGVIRPEIIIPSDITDWTDRNTLCYILMHELTHIKRHDNAVNLIIMLLSAVNWFNPVLWYAFSKMKEDCEISCDASVLADLSNNERKAYGYAIVNVLQTMPNKPIPGTAGFTNNFSKRRIVMIANNKKAPIIFSALALTVTMLAGFVSLPASAQKAPAVTSNPSAAQTAVKSSKTSNNWIYYVNNKANLKIYRRHADGTGNMKVTNTQSQCPTVVGNWIYYLNISDGQRIYKIHGDGTGNKMVSFTCPCAQLSYSGGYLYFSAEFTDTKSDSGKLYRMKPDGLNRQKLSDDYVGCASINGGNIYYSGADDNKLYRMSSDGKDKVKISDDNINDFFISGSMLYYIDHKNNALAGKIYKIRLNGTGKTAVGKDNAQQIAFYGNMIYYYTSDTNLYKMHTDGTGKTKVKRHSWEETRAFGHVSMTA